MHSLAEYSLPEAPWSITHSKKTSSHAARSPSPLWSVGGRETYPRTPATGVHRTPRVNTSTASARSDSRAAASIARRIAGGDHRRGEAACCASKRRPEVEARPDCPTLRGRSSALPADAASCGDGRRRSRQELSNCTHGSADFLHD